MTPFAAGLHGIAHQYTLLNLAVVLLNVGALACLIPTFRKLHMTSYLAGIFLFIIFAILGGLYAVKAVYLPSREMTFLQYFFVFSGMVPPLLYLMVRAHPRLIAKVSAEQRAEKFTKLKDEFVSVASHELRTPLSVISGFTEILVREKLGPLNDEQKRRLRKVLMQGQRLNRIIDSLLDMSRLRAGRVDVKKQAFDIIPVLKSALDDQQVVCEQQKIRLVDQIPDVLPDVQGDLERVMQVVVNLLTNAIKYTPEGGTVTLTASYDRKKKRVRVEIQDTGIGIDPGDQGRIFEEFYRASHTHKQKYPGSGLGLAIVKQLVDAMNGEVGLFSEGLDKGSMFFFSLPVAKSPALSRGSAVEAIRQQTASS